MPEVRQTLLANVWHSVNNIFYDTINLQPNQMYKIYTKKTGLPSGYAYKLLLIMRLTTVLLIATIMQVSASGLAQKITINKKNAPIDEVINEIRKQSGYD